VKKGVVSGVTFPTTESGKSGLPAGIYRRESFAIKKTNIIEKPKNSYSGEVPFKRSKGDVEVKNNWLDVPLIYLATCDGIKYRYCI